ncbi:hypothetical protein ONZ45_g15898 [Pleurotus djamor]|nr:hypothetical protein ONZ45_g15898 [Pleurotus djamor]
MSASLNTYAISALLIAGPWLYFTGRSRHHPTPNAPPIRPYVSLVLLLHTLYLLYKILVTPPSNIFTSLKIPLNTSTDQIRAILAQHAGLDLTQGDVFPKPLELLLKRLSLFDHRKLYVRFGQYVLQTCEYCTTFDEFALYALPQHVLSYIHEVTILGLVTIRGTQRERWRTMAICAAIAGGLSEIYWLYTVPVSVPRRGEKTDVIMWHDTLYFIRQICFIAVPLIIHLLPASPNQSAIAAIPNAIQLSERALTRLHLIKYMNGSILRTPALRKQAEKWWDEEKKEGEWIRGDEEVRRLAHENGFGFGPFGEEGEVGKLRANADQALQGLLREGLAVHTS